MMLGALEVREPHLVPRRRPRAHLLPHPRPRVGVGEVPPQRGQPPVERPLRDHDVEAGRAVGVGVAVEGDVEPFGAGVLDEREHAGRPAGRGRALVEVGDVRGNPGAPADLERLPERVEEAIPQAVAHVGVVEAAEPARLLRQGHQLLGIGVAPGRVVEPGRHAAGALFHRRPEERALIPAARPASAGDRPSRRPTRAAASCRRGRRC